MDTRVRRGRDSGLRIWGVAAAVIGVLWARSEERDQGGIETGAPARTAVWRHEEWIEGLRARGVDVADAAAVWDVVWESLPGEVRVWPSENYYYWQLAADGRVLHGNIRLAPELRARGEVAFAYGESREFLDEAELAERLAVSRTFSAADGVAVEMGDAFTARISYRGRAVVFHLDRLPQELPEGFPLGPDEVLLQRTQDECGLKFFLLYHREARHFFWVLDESEGVPEHFRALAPDVLMGRRTGFVFWQQESPGPRKILASVRRASLDRNDHHDGPFDQLADNHVRGDGLRPYLEEAMPWLRGRVDPWGRLLDSSPPRRVALTCHGVHDRADQAVARIAEAKAHPDPLARVAAVDRREHGGR
ncbi:MAG: hypothetical protein ACKV19_11160 [Verrucomicrobiales bacterium]